MAPPRLYTEVEVREAMRLGMQLGIACDPHIKEVGPTQEKALTDALELYAPAHGTPVPNFEHFRGLLSRREYKTAAEGHLAAAEMLEGPESMRHAALGQLAASIELCGEVRDAASDVAQTLGRG